MKERIAIVDGVRTPFSKSGGVFKNLSADDLGAIAVKELLARTAFPVDEIDEVIIGNVMQPVKAANVARVIALKAGIPKNVPAYTVHRNCASGMEAITSGANKILAGEADVIIAGGTESMSGAPLIFGQKMTDLFGKLFRAKTFGQKIKAMLGFRPSMLKPIISLQVGLCDAYAGLNMGETAEVLAREFSISREDQDKFSLLSHQRAQAAQEGKTMGDEVVPVPAPPKYEKVVEQDDGVRYGQSMEALTKLRPIFDKVAGTVTAGNASQITDGAAAVLLMRESEAKKRGLKPMGFLRDYAYAALDGKRMGLGPVFASAKLFDKTALDLNAFDLIEINEAFAAQTLACVKAFGSEEFARKELGRDKALGSINMDILNVNGGAIALGHPVGASGARLTITILKELHRRNKNRGLATLCVGGGQGAALALEVE